MVEEFLKLVKGHKVVAFTGAGASAESGVPTFHGERGLWTKYDPAVFATIPDAFYTFLKDPQAIADFVVDFYETLLKANPNATHRALAYLEKTGVVKGVITQNIDNLHQFAGTENISELHGNSYRFVCRRCGYTRTKTKEEIRSTIPDFKKKNLSKKELIKHIFSFMGRCPCKKTLMSSVVFFGQGLPLAALEKAHQLINQAGVLLCIGTRGVVMPAASFPFYAKERGCKIIEINPEVSEISPIADLRIIQPAGLFFSSVLECLDNLNA